MAKSDHIRNVAIVGAGGNVGRLMTEALLKTGKHNVTAIAREESQSIFPDGIEVRRVDLGARETVVAALRGQDALVITLSGFTPKETGDQLIHAAGEAGVPWILPNEWSPDTANEQLVKDVSMFQPKVATRKAIEELGKSSYIAVSTGFWYDWCLAIPGAFGINFDEHTANLFDEGDTKISTSTMSQVGRAVAALLSLPVKPEGATQACLERFKNQVVYVNSFSISQKEMLASVQRVSGTKEQDWGITKEPAQQRYKDGLEEVKEGKRSGFGKVMFTRVFWSDGCGDFEHSKGTLNSLLKLPVEDIDEATQAAYKRWEDPEWIGRKWG
ncbi:MAG: hypothetical protein M1828_001197 [Chrysothrix sp. TS-e1954]|nr:MAG: hypothetical protein M1828_001197 [Chrysothrix sp. TS-e1954]